MKMMRYGLMAVVACTAFGTLFGGDAERNDSGAMNARSVAAERRADGGVKVLFLGNSITLHGACEEIGWTNEWGMAASALEKDYVHIVTRGIEKETGRKADVKVRNIADFERGLAKWNAAEKLADEVKFDPDYLVFAVGENAKDLTNDVDRIAFRTAFSDLVGLFLKGRTERPNVIVRGVFWPNSNKDAELSRVASDYAVPFVSACLSWMPEMKATGKFAHRGVCNHPGDRGMEAIAQRILEAFFPKDSGYEVWMDGRPVQARPIRISAMPFNQWAPGYQRPVDQTEIAGMVTVEAEGRSSFRVKPSRRFATARVRPLSAKVTPAVKDGEVTFELPKCGHYVLELDDSRHLPLEIFVEPKRDFAAERRAANIVFGPGRHEPAVVRLKSHDRVYIDRDAFVLGSFQMDGVEDVRISGYGVICGSRNRREGDDCYRTAQATPLRIVDSKNIVIDGPVVVDSPCWCVSAFNSSDLVFSHLKVTGAWRYNTDGIDICNSQRVTIRDCYVHSFDDAIVIKGIPGDRASPVEDILVERCTCWCGWGRTLETGYETWAPRWRNVVFEDCDLIHNTHAALSVHIGGPATIENLTFRNIRAEYAADATQPCGQWSREAKYPYRSRKPWSGDVIAIQNDKMFTSNGTYNAAFQKIFGNVEELIAEPMGTLAGVRIEGLHIVVDEGAKTPRVFIRSELKSVYGEIGISGIDVNGRSIGRLEDLPRRIEGTMDLGYRPAADASRALKVSVLGDSYSTYEGAIPKGNAIWYFPAPNNANDVTLVEQCWWHLVTAAIGGRLERNESWSGSTVCNTGYYGRDFSDMSFVARSSRLGDPDLILVCGATNDSWCGAPIGEYMYSGFTPKDLYAFRPAMAKMCGDLKAAYPKARIYFILNDCLKPAINDSVHEICRHYGLPCIDLRNISKQKGHPSIKGMREIADQVVARLRADGVAAVDESH